MELLIFLLFMGLFVSSINWLRLVAKLFRALREKHPSKYEAMGKPGVISNNTLATNRALYYFLVRKEYLSLSDNDLTKQSQFMRVYFVWHGVLMAALVIGVVVLQAGHAP